MIFLFEAAYLDISLISLEANVRREFYTLINEDKLMRSIKVMKPSHFNIPKGSQAYFFPNASSFTQVPEWVILMMITEKQHLGDFSNRFVYKHRNLTHLITKKNGVDHYGNESQKEMKLDEIMGKDTQYWYKKMLACFPPPARTISLKHFVSNFFLFCIDLKPTPTHMYPENEASPLHLVSSGTLDFELTFKENVPENMVLYIISKQSGIVQIGPTGEIEEIVT